MMPDPLRELAEGLIKDPDARQKDKIDALLQLGVSTDRRLDELNGRVRGVEEVANKAASHPFHQISNKNVVIFLVGVTAYTLSVIQESREWLLDFFGLLQP